METKARIHDISIDFESGKRLFPLYAKKTYEGNMTD